MAERAWYRSLYWRIAIGFVCFLGVTLAIQASLFLWIIVRAERDVSARSLDVFASMVATDVAAEIEANGLTNVERHLVDRYGSLPRPIWVIMNDGAVISGRWGPPPPGLVRRLRLRSRSGGSLLPPGTDEGFGLLRLRRTAGASVVVGGRPVGTVIVQAGRPSELVAREIGPMLLLIALSLVIGVGALASVLIFRPASRRLRELADTARRLGAGDTTARAPETGGDEIAGVARAFNQMAGDLVHRAEALQTSDRVRRQLLADVSHELMTPLTAIRGYLETLEMPSIALDDGTRGRYLGIVREESLRLERIIGDLLDLARLEAGGSAFTMEDVPIGQIFARVLARHEHASREGGVALEARGDQTILARGDPLRLEQALQNLAANALRHTPSGGRVVLGVERRGESVVLSVQDSGAGIQPEHLPHVFDRFYKADASRAEESGAGSGIGLSIVKAIVERHGGRISVRSAPGVDTVFEIVLPDDDARLS
ncbi:MAG TPA: HAMP domain-containing sensor histidine kinase [Vicinamibacterales bacterium]